MKQYIIVPMILLLMSCTPSLKDDFRDTIIAYQKEFPIPADAVEIDTNWIYIYHAYFSVHDKDTVFSVHRTYSQIENGLFEGRKIFYDHKMKSLEITDLFNKSGEMTDETAKNQEYTFWDSGTGNNEQFTTLYWYKVKNNKIHFWKKDTTFVDRMNQLRNQVNQQP